MQNKNFNYVGPINSTGYGIASIGYLNALLKENNGISTKAISGKTSFSEPISAILTSIENKPILSDPTFCFWHLFDIPNQISEFTGPKIGFTTFELDTLKKEEVAALSLLDKIGTASEWGKSVLAKYIDPNKIFVANHAYNEEPVSIIDHNIDVIDNNKIINATWSKVIAPISLSAETLFLSTAGKFESRKGHPELIDACIEYGKTNPVVLIAYFYNPFIQDNFPFSFLNSRFLYPEFTSNGIKVYKKNNFRLVMMPPANKRAELHSALQKANYFISPSKGEGWNLPLYEMMSIGMPCITTLYSAHTEYCNKDNIIPVKGQGMTVANDGIFFRGNGNWLNVTSDEIFSAIKIANNYKDNSNYINNLINLAKKATNKSWQQEAKKIQRLINQY